MNKRKTFVLFVFIVIAIAAATLSYFIFHHYKSKTEENNATANVSMNEFKLDTAVSYAIMEHNKGCYMEGECQAEGHHILDSGSDGTTLTAYVLTMYGEYGFEDGNFVKVGGSGVIPAVITFCYDENDDYLLTNYQTAMDGGMYGESIKQMFPERLQEQCLRVDEDIFKDLKEQELKYATAYLETIGRDAVIGSYGDFEHTLLTDAGVSVDVSNMMTQHDYYPFWIGNRERIEDGIRYVYMMNYNAEEQKISYVKTIYDTLTIVEEITYDSETGEIIYDSRKRK